MVRRSRQQRVEAAAAAKKAAAVATAPEWELLGFGEAARRHFLIDCSTFTHLNHGSYGVTPRVVLEEAIGVLKEVEAFPDDFFRAKAWPRYQQLCEVVGGFVGAPGPTITLVPNATTAVNSVLYSAANIRAGDAVLMTDITYNALQIAIRDHCASVGARVVVVPIAVGVPGATTSLEAFNAGALLALNTVLDSDPTIKWALLDHISSMPSVIYPIADMVAACHKRGVRVMVDGAHAPGQLPLDVAAVGADWYTGNLHKWSFTSKGVAFLYAREDRQEGLNPVVASHYHLRSYQERFFMQGTIDYSGYCAVPAALAFVKSIGGFEAVRKYNFGLVIWAAYELAALWHTELLVEPRLCASMCMVRAPLEWAWFMPPGSTIEEANVDYGIHERIARAVFTLSGVSAQFRFYNGSVFVRLSAQVYNTRSDYIKLGVAVQDLAADIARKVGSGR